SIREELAAGISTRRRSSVPDVKPDTTVALPGPDLHKDRGFSAQRGPCRWSLVGEAHLFWGCPHPSGAVRSSRGGTSGRGFDEGMKQKMAPRARTSSFFPDLRGERLVTQPSDEALEP